MNSPLPLVSVIVPAYNHEPFVKECLESIEKQTYPNLELLIVNDGSVDQTGSSIRDWISSQKREWVRLEYIEQANQGVTATLNRALIWAHGKYFSLIASDDILCFDKIRLLVEELEAKGTSHAVAFGNAMFIDDAGSPISLDIKDSEGRVLDRQHLFLNYYTYGKNFKWSNPEVFGSYWSLLSGNYLPAMSCVINTASIRSVGGWTAKNTVEDWELWLKLAKEFKFVFVDQVVAYYRWHEGNTSKTKRAQILTDSIWLLENEKAYAMKLKFHKHFFPVYQYYLTRLKEFDSKRSFEKKLSLLKDREYYKFYLDKIKEKLNG